MDIIEMVYLHGEPRRKLRAKGAASGPTVTNDDNFSMKSARRKKNKKYNFRN